jgi:D-alanine-D-alanine ligase
LKYNFYDLKTIIPKLKSNLRIAVVYGGNKDTEGSVIYRTNNPRSWKSYQLVAEDIAQALRELGFKHVSIFSDDMHFISRIKDEKIDLVWLNTGGVQGYIPMSHAAAMLEMVGIPYIGHNPQNAGIMDSKHIFKHLLMQFGIPTSKFVLFPQQHLSEESLDVSMPNLDRLLGSYEGPFIVKPVSGRASLNVIYAQSKLELPEIISEIYKKTRNWVIVEQFLPGREFCVSVCGDIIARNGDYEKMANPFAFSIIERILNEDEYVFTSMDKKPITTDRILICDPEKDRKIIDLLKSYAHKIYRDFQLETLVRIDLRTDAKGNLFVLETNPKPDLKKPEGKSTSLTCIGLDDHKLSYRDLIESIFSQRLHYSFSFHQNSIGHIIDLTS